MAQCRLCLWMRERLCVDCTAFHDDLHRRSRKWERESADEPFLYRDESAPDRARLDEARDRYIDDKAAGYTLYRELAKEGSTFAKYMVAWCLETGNGCTQDRDFAASFYWQIATEGSWLATLDYARVMEDLGHRDIARQTLLQGVDAGYLPANFYLAEHIRAGRYDKATAREVANLLEAPAAAGHPWAEVILARLLVRGKLGWQGRWRGLRIVYRDIRRRLTKVPEDSVERGAAGQPA